MRAITAALTHSLRQLPPPYTAAVVINSAAFHMGSLSASPRRPLRSVRSVARVNGVKNGGSSEWLQNRQLRCPVSVSRIMILHFKNY